MESLSKNEILLLSHIGYILYKEGQYGSAISVFEGLSELQPDFEQFHSVLTVLYHLTNKPDIALQHGLKALPGKPNDITLLITLGEVYLALKRPDHARDVLQRALAETRRLNHPAQNRVQLLLQSAR